MPAFGRAEYPLTFKPLTMSRPSGPHMGSVFFPIPDGSGLLYTLEGEVRDLRPCTPARPARLPSSCLAWRPSCQPSSHPDPCPQANTPAPEAVVERCVPAKARHVEVLQVPNWLHRPQRFAVTIERLAADVATKLEGASHIEVPGGATRQYSLAWYSYTQVGEISEPTTYAASPAG